MKTLIIVSIKTQVSITPYLYCSSCLKSVFSFFHPLLSYKSQQQITSAMKCPKIVLVSQGKCNG